MFARNKDVDCHNLRPFKTDMFPPNVMEIQILVLAAPMYWWDRLTAPVLMVLLNIHNKRLKLQDELDEHFAGPAFLPWGRMGNLR